MAAGREEPLVIGGKITFLSGVLASLAFGWFAFPHLLFQRAPQPFRFSHKVHAGAAGMSCQDCHAILEDGRFAGIPSVEKCAGCHAAPVGSTPDEKVLVEQYVTPGKEIPWRVYARQPDNVYFPHVNHVKAAKLACERCHGGHGKTDALRPYEYDPITGYSRDLGEARLLRVGATRPVPEMRMDDCAACHKERKVETGCLDCHK
jgi:hypothetical protein